MKIKKNMELLFLAIGVVLIWRGVWGLLDVYLFPSNDTLSYIISALIGLIILYSHNNNLRELL